MPSPKKVSREAMIRRYESPDYDVFEGKTFEVVTGPPIPAPPPLSVRLSKPLLDALDRIAATQHRKRSNLIQHILWEYVHSQDA